MTTTKAATPQKAIPPTAVATSGTYRINTSRPEESAQSWTGCAESYDVFAEAVTRPFAEDALRLVELAPNAKVLDVAAGTGAFTLAAARKNAEVLATDFSEGMLAKLEQKCTSLNLGCVQTAEMDGQHLTLADNTFELSASFFGLMFFPDHGRGLRELHRVTQPGGRTLISCWAPPARVEMMRLIGEAAMSAQIDAPSLPAPAPWLTLSTPRGMQTALRTAGFKHAHVVSVTHVWALRSARELANLLPTMTPSSASLFASMSSTERKLFVDALVAGFHARQGQGPYAVTSEALIGVATK